MIAWSIFSVPAIRSPRRRSRIAVPNIIPGTRSIIAPIIIESTLRSANKMCENPATVAAKNDEMTVFAILLSLAERWLLIKYMPAPIKRVMSASRSPPPKKRQKAEVATADEMRLTHHG